MNGFGHPNKDLVFRSTKQCRIEIIHIADVFIVVPEGRAAVAVRYVCSSSQCERVRDGARVMRAIAHRDLTGRGLCRDHQRSATVLVRSVDIRPTCSMCTG